MSFIVFTSTHLALIGCICPAAPEIPSTRIFLLLLFPQVVKPVFVEIKHTVLVDTEEVVDELDTKNKLGCLDLKRTILKSLNCELSCLYDWQQSYELLIIIVFSGLYILKATLIQNKFEAQVWKLNLKH